MTGSFSLYDRLRKSLGGTSRPPAVNEIVQRKPARAEDQDNERRNEEGVGGGGIEILWLGKNRHQCSAIGSDVSDKHIDGEHQCEQTAAEPNCQQNATEELKTTHEIGVQRGRRNAEAGEELHHMGQVVELAPAGLAELPSPVQPHEQKEQRLQGIATADEERIRPPQFIRERCHDCCPNLFCRTSLGMTRARTMPAVLRPPARRNCPSSSHTPQLPKGACRRAARTEDQMPRHRVA